MGWLRARLANLLAGFWLVPGATALLLALIGVALVRVDRAGWADWLGLGFGGDAAAARGILTAIAGALITVVALTLSLTVVTLQLVSGQFTPRAVRGVLADRTTQVVTGVFVGSVAYSLVVLRAVRDVSADEGVFSPSLSTAVAIALALLSLALLIVFVHHIAHVIQVSSILGRVGRETLAAVERLHPDAFDPAEAPMPSPPAQDAAVVARPHRAGFVQALALGDLDAIPGDAVVAEVDVRAGDFVTARTDAMRVWGATPDADVKSVAERVIVVGDERDLRQDIAFGVRQLVDIAARALSPGTVDPTTAVTAIGWSRAVLERLATRDLRAKDAVLDDGRVVARTRGRTFREYVEAGVGEIARYANGDVRVTVALLDALAGIEREAQRAGAAERARIVRSLADEVAGRALEHIAVDRDRDEITAARRTLPRSSS